MRLEASKPAYRGVIWWMTNQCFKGAELPTRPQFDAAYDVGDIFVATKGDQVQGYALLTVEYGGFNGTYLQSIAVLPEYRGHGLGTRLLHEIHDFCRRSNKASVFLHCKSTSSVVQFYMNEGYVLNKVVENYYAPEGNGYELEIKL